MTIKKNDITLKEIKWVVQLLEDEGMNKNDISILHCNTEYPTPMKDVNLLAMSTIKKALKTNIGYSDHTLGIEIPIAAVALGARIIEKHFTLNRNMSGPDHLASLEPSELKQMIQSIRNIELALSGNSKKEPSLSEQKNIAIARKSIHLNVDLKKGAILQMNDLIILRPGDGISPQFIEKVIGKKVKTDLSKGTKLTWELIK
jgi:N-acetylneuraminate synthase/N,N'-diacetyllegionaminate synthase